MEEKSPFDSRTLIALAVCLLLWFGWQKHLETKYPQMLAPAAKTQHAQQKQETKDQVSVAQTSPKGTVNNDLKAETKKVVLAKNEPEKTWVSENDQWKVVVSNVGGKIQEVKLKRYTSNKNNGTFVLIDPSEKGLLLTSTEGKTTRDFSNVVFHMENPSENEVVLTGEDQGQFLRKRLTFFPDQYLVKVDVAVEGKTEQLKSIIFSNGMEIPKQEEASSFLSFGPAATANYQEFFFYHRNKKERDIITFKETPTKSFDQVQLAAIGGRYFTSLYINKSSVIPNVSTLRDDKNSILNVSYPVLDENSSQKIDFDLYLGPKSLGILEKIDPSLNVIVDYGMFSVIAVPLLGVMKWFYGIVGNYGLAIILLTLLVRSLTFPFTYMSYKSMKAMQKIQPEVAQLKERYKGNTQAFNVEVMKLYKENKVNPMGGCLPMLLQLPVFWALYQVLQNSIELYKAPFVGWIVDLSQKDPYYVLPVLMGAAMFMQQKLTPSTMDPAQAKMMMYMPIFFSFLMIGLPSGLTLYIFVSTLFGIIQQLFIMKDRNPRSAKAVTV